MKEIRRNAAPSMLLKTEKITSKALHSREWPVIELHFVENVVNLKVGGFQQLNRSRIENLVNISKYYRICFKCSTSSATRGKTGCPTC